MVGSERGQLKLRPDELFNIFYSRKRCSGLTGKNLATILDLYYNLYMR
jgi:hypothetical protein